MIVRATATTLQLITQPDHAALARRIMDRWIADGLPDSPRRASILHAVEQHDNGWIEPDAAPLVDPSSGRIADFITAPTAIRQAVWPRGVARLSADPWAAALVAQHAIHIYRRYDSDPEWQPFFAEMAHRRDALVERTRLSLEDLLADYRFLRIGDLMSLVFCNAWTEEHQHAHYGIRYVAPSLMIAPNPFDGDGFAIAVAARELTPPTFADANAARAAWTAAPVVTVRGVASGSRP